MIYVIISAVIVIALIVFLILRRAQLIKNGTFGPVKVRSIMKSASKFRNCRVLNDVKLEYKDKTMNFENILVGPFGMVFADSLGEYGEYYGSSDSEKWVRISKDGKRTEVPNFYKRSLGDIVTLREVFSKNDLYKIPLEHFTVIALNSKKTNICINSTPDLIELSKFKKLLKSSKYDADNGVDVQKLCDFLCSCKK
ncbi:MAG: hypothetical protein J5874_02980 [Oscillospiraceae bacterium]|nr:hypothetical protein [Oscillospiraceae bacterium]